MTESNTKQQQRQEQPQQQQGDDAMMTGVSINVDPAQDQTRQNERKQKKRERKRRRNLLPYEEQRSKLVWIGLGILILAVVALIVALVLVDTSSSNNNTTDNDIAETNQDDTNNNTPTDTNVTATEAPAAFEFTCPVLSGEAARNGTVQLETESNATTSYSCPDLVNNSNNTAAIRETLIQYYYKMKLCPRDFMALIESASDQSSIPASTIWNATHQLELQLLEAVAVEYGLQNENGLACHNTPPVDGDDIISLVGINTNPPNQIESSMSILPATQLTELPSCETWAYCTFTFQGLMTATYIKNNATTTVSVDNELQRFIQQYFANELTSIQLPEGNASLVVEYIGYLYP